MDVRPREHTGDGRSATRGTGPRRNSDAHEAILEATWMLLGKVGYHDLTIEGVASLANVGKTTIYRWWSSKGILAAEAIARHLVIGPPPHTGDVRADLRASIQATIDNYSGTVAGVVLPALVADLVYDPKDYQFFRKSFLEPRRDAATSAIRRAIDEGLLASDTDVGLVLDLWSGLVFYRALISREPIPEDLADRLTNLLLSDAWRAVGGPQVK